MLGLPKNMDGTEGARAELCKAFAQKLREASGLPVNMWDERRTTVEAHNILSQHNYHGKKRKEIKIARYNPRNWNYTLLGEDKVSLTLQIK